MKRKTHGIIPMNGNCLLNWEPRWGVAHGMGFDRMCAARCTACHHFCNNYDAFHSPCLATTKRYQFNSEHWRQSISCSPIDSQPSHKKNGARSANLKHTYISHHTHNTHAQVISNCIWLCNHIFFYFDSDKVFA